MRLVEAATEVFGHFIIPASGKDRDMQTRVGVALMRTIWFPMLMTLTGTIIGCTSGTPHPQAVQATKADPQAEADRTRVKRQIEGFAVGKTTQNDLIDAMLGSDPGGVVNKGERTPSGWVWWETYVRTERHIDLSGGFGASGALSAAADKGTAGGGPGSSVRETEYWDVGYTGGILATLTFRNRILIDIRLRGN